MELSVISKRMVLVICISSLVFIVSSAVYYRSLGFFPFGLGVLCGASLNIFKLIIFERIVNRALELEKTNASNYLRIQYFLRFVLTGILLVIAVKVPFISLWGTAAGIFTLQVAAWSMAFFPVLDETKNNEAMP